VLPCIGSAHIILVGIDPLRIKTVPAVSFFLRRTETDPDVAVEAENDINAGGSARRWEMVKVRFKPADKVWCDRDELAVS
jgi:hypothetical protein